MAPKFGDMDIKLGLIVACDEAIAACSRKFHAHRKGSHQGLEKIFEGAVLAAIEEFPGWTCKTRIRRQDFPKHSYRSDGWVDAVATHDSGYRVGLEFKVCELPRLRANS